MQSTATDTLTPVRGFDARPTPTPHVTPLVTLRPPAPPTRRVIAVWLALGLTAWGGTIGAGWLTLRLLAGVT